MSSMLRLLSLSWILPPVISCTFSGLRHREGRPMFGCCSARVKVGGSPAETSLVVAGVVADEDWGCLLLLTSALAFVARGFNVMFPCVNPSHTC